MAADRPIVEQRVEAPKWQIPFDRIKLIQKLYGRNEMQINVTELKALVDKILKKSGYKTEEVKIISDILMYAQLRGNNQGIVKLIGKGLPKNPEAGKVTVDRETKLSALLHGNHNSGMVVVTQAMEMALSKAKEHGFGIVGTHHTSSSTGAIGYYAQKIAEEGYIGWVFAGSPETVSTHGSYQPIFGTNPLSIGLPSTRGPVVLDMATSAMAYFGLVEAKTAGRSIPGDVAFDSTGELTTDPAKAMEGGAIRPFDRSYKGAGLSFMVEALTGPFVHAAFTGVGETRTNWGNLVYVMDPELLVDRKEFMKNVDQMASQVKATKKLPNVEEIYIPGERGDRLAKKHREEGSITVEDNLLKQLKEAAGE